MRALAPRLPLSSPIAAASPPAQQQQRFFRPAAARRPRRTLASLVGLALAATLGGCGDDQAAGVTTLAVSGNPQQGRALIRYFGCGSCHTIPGVDGADSDVGPPLTRIGRRIYVAGMLRNTPDNLARWIEHPQQIVPGNAMPEMGVTRRQAQDIAAYLYTLR